MVKEIILLGNPKLYKISSNIEKEEIGNIKEVVDDLHDTLIDFKSNRMKLDGDLSELLQHEYDHLDGILATMRAVDDKAFCLKSERSMFDKLKQVLNSGGDSFTPSEF
ncbi:MAG: peptide deformylase [Clostridium sp.]|uniref:peptide deformylase n=1 Tax=Clostridium sp. TaxID=1506 RepID=UPI0039EB4901